MTLYVDLLYTASSRNAAPEDVQLAIGSRVVLQQAIHLTPQHERLRLCTQPGAIAHMLTIQQQQTALCSRSQGLAVQSQPMSETWSASNILRVKRVAQQR